MKHRSLFHYYYMVISIAASCNHVAFSLSVSSQHRMSYASRTLLPTSFPSFPRRRYHLRERDGDGEEMYTFDKGDNASDNDNTDSTSTTDRLDDLTAPSINLARGSILFSENPSTQRNNDFLSLWRFCKVNLPAVITGAFPWKDADVADDNPIGGLYNIAFVRMPVIAVGFIYGKNLWEGHPLVMDIGDGPFVMSPLVVLIVIALILA